MAGKVIKGILLDERTEFSLAELSRACTRHAEWIVELVDEGILEPVGRHPREWRFPAESITRAQKAMRLQRDLQVNLAGIALILDLMDQIDTMRSRLRRLEQSGRNFGSPG